MSSLIEFKNVSKTYRTGETELHALKQVTLTIDYHEFIALIGHSGSGKSTLMHIIGLLDRPTSGSYHLDGKEISTLEDDALAELRNKKIGFVFQSFFLLPRLNIEQNVALPLLYRGLNIHKAREYSKEMLEKVGLAKYGHHKPNQLSGGQQQRVAIARALVGKPEVILADEPTGALDSKTSQDIIDLFKNLHKHEKTTIIIVTHNLEISNQFKRVITMKDGEILTDEDRSYEF